MVLELRFSWRPNFEAFEPLRFVLKPVCVSQNFPPPGKTNIKKGTWPRKDEDLMMLSLGKPRVEHSCLVTVPMGETVSLGVKVAKHRGQTSPEPTVVSQSGHANFFESFAMALAKKIYVEFK